MLRMFVAGGVMVALVAGCAGRSAVGGQPQAPKDYGVLVMAHGGKPEWNQGVLDAVKPLQREYRIEVAFGMADATTIQQGVRKLEAEGVRKVGVVRLFVSGESWYERTEQILGLAPGAPAAPAHDHHADHSEHAGHDMAFWKVETRASYALSRQGLVEAPEMGGVLAERARALSRNSGLEDVLIIAHGPADDAENERWIGYLNSRAEPVRQILPFRRVAVETLREDWPEKRKEAEERIRAFVQRASEEGGKAIVIPFRVQGFGPYSKVLDNLDYASDGQGLLPHPGVTEWIEHQIVELETGPFRKTIDH